MIGRRLASRASSRLANRFLRRLERADEIQQATLFGIMRANEDTWFGTKHGFRGIRSVNDFRAAVPLTRYEAMGELVARIAAGERGVLTQEPVTYLLVTSGTSASPKMIPVTPAWFKETRFALATAAGLAASWAIGQQMRLDRGLILASNGLAGVTSGGIRYGPINGVLAQRARRFWDCISVVPFDVTRIADNDAKRYMYWRFALLAHRLAFVAAPYTPYLISLAVDLKEQTESLVRDIADGRVCSRLPLTREERERFARLLRPAPARARLLEALASQGGLVPRTVWPDLGLVFAIHAQTFCLYEPPLHDLYGDKPVWGAPYTASEGILGVAHQVDSYSHLPAVSVGYLEFIPEEEWGSEASPACLSLKELELGRRYEVVLTGRNGLYRYRVGDVIEVDGSMHGVPCFRVVGRRGSMLSVVWERMTEAQILIAFSESLRQTSLDAVDFVADIDRSATPPRYRFWIELRPDKSIPGSLALTLDGCLRRASPAYGTLRDSREIGFPEVQCLATHTFANMIRRRERNGAYREQLKVQHVSADARSVLAADGRWDLDA